MTKKIKTSEQVQQAIRKVTNDYGVVKTVQQSGVSWCVLFAAAMGNPIKEYHHAQVTTFLTGLGAL
jgi:hypothetical protein